MGVFVKDGGVWKESGAGGLSIKDGGVWKAVQNGYVRDANVWQQYYQNLPAIGEPFQGGYFAGLISQTGNNVPTHALIVASNTGGSQTNVQFKVDSTQSAGIDSKFDGAANTAAIANSSHPAALFCSNLVLGGFSDWYLPAIAELEIAYFNLKPTTTSNNTNSPEYIFGSTTGNVYAIPQRGSTTLYQPTPYTASNPARTSSAAFISGQPEAFSTSSIYWSSTSTFEIFSQYRILFDSFSDGNLSGQVPGFNARADVRAFRKISI